MNYDIFISYKRRGASLAAAPYLFELLQQRGYNVFLDTKEMRSGHFDDQLLEYISNAKDIIILLEEESLKSWFSEKDSFTASSDLQDAEETGSAESIGEHEPQYKTDWFCKEVIHALSLEGKRIIPLLLNGFQMPEPKDLPPEMFSLPRNQALSVDLSDMEHLIDKYFIGKEYLTSTPQNLALSRQYQAKGGIIGNFLFYTSAASCELNEYGEKIITLTRDNDEKHPFKYPVSFAGEHRFHLFNNDTCEEKMIAQVIDPNCQKYINVEWTETQNLWELTDDMILHQEDPKMLYSWGSSLFNGTAKNSPDLYRSVICLERAVSEGYGPACEFMKASGGISHDSAESAVMLRWYTLADKCGSLDGCKNLGNAYYFGRGVDVSYETAAHFYEKAAGKGHDVSIYNLAHLYYRGHGVEQSYDKAAELYCEAAEMGYASAQYNLALMFQKGIGVEQSPAKAFELLNKAAEQGHANALCDLGLMYVKGTGVEKNEAKGIELYTKAADKGSPVAMNRLAIRYETGNGVEKNIEKAFRLYRDAALQGYAMAQYNLALSYYYGKGVKKSVEKAAEFFEKVADQGYAKAQYKAAYMYQSGKGVYQSLERAVDLYEKAAEQGLADAQYSLADLYRKGEGVEKSLEKAAELYTKAANQGYAKALNSLAMMYQSGEGVEKSLEKAAELYNAAAEKDYPRAYNNLAWTLHLMGRYEEALPWAEKAAKAFPNSPYISDTLATVYQGLGRYEEAMTAFEKCLCQYEQRNNETMIEETKSKIESLKKMMDR